LRRSILLTILIAVVVLAVGLAVAGQVIQPGGSPLTAASIALPAISPNADGQADITGIHYALRRPASVSIYFLNAAGERFYFRQDKPRAAGAYDINFSGVVDAYTLPALR